MEGDAPEREIDFDFDVSEEAGAAVYANIVSIWYSPYEFALDWGGRTWTLKVDDTRPGLSVRGEPIGPLLALEGLATTGRRGADALSGGALVDFERRGDRIEATYAPPGWGEMSVRAAW